MVVKRNRAARRFSRETGRSDLQLLLEEIDELSKGPIGSNSVLDTRVEMDELRQARRQIFDLVTLSE